MRVIEGAILGALDALAREPVIPGPSGKISVHTRVEDSRTRKGVTDGQAVELAQLLVDLDVESIGVFGEHRRRLIVVC